MLATLFLYVCVLTALPLPQETKDLASPIPKLFETRYGAARALEVKFLERYTENGRFVRAESGMAYFLKPGKMRWDYEAPERNTFLVDGKYVWFYSPADRTATRMLASHSEDWRTPLALLTTHMKLSKLCGKIAQESDGEAVEPGDVVFRCELKGEKEPASRGQAERGRYKGVLFEVTPRGELRRIVVKEEAGRELEFSFSGWKFDAPREKTMFEFVPPRGVAIVNGMLPETPGLCQ
jgi:outer membrane lipoprotein carrier protein